MEILLYVLGAVIVFWFLGRSLRRKKPKIDRSISGNAPTLEVKITSSLSTAFEPPDVGPLTPQGRETWLLNPEASFHLTIAEVGKDDAQEIKQILDQSFSNAHGNSVRKLTPIIARSNAKCIEISKYISEFKPIYINRLNELISSSEEWQTASEKDREDILISLKHEAIHALDVRPDCDLEVLFECEPADVTLDDELIDRYGFDNLQLYLRYFDNLHKVHVIPADHYYRKDFEQLCNVGLARQGKAIPFGDILNALKLKDLNELAGPLIAKPFTRKAKAIEFLQTVPDIEEKFGKVVAFRELFQLTPLDDRFSGIDLAGC